MTEDKSVCETNNVSKLEGPSVMNQPTDRTFDPTICSQDSGLNFYNTQKTEAAQVPLDSIAHEPKPNSMMLETNQHNDSINRVQNSQDSILTAREGEILVVETNPKPNKNLRKSQQKNQPEKGAQTARTSNGKNTFKNKMAKKTGSLADPKGSPKVAVDKLQSISLVSPSDNATTARDNGQDDSVLSKTHDELTQLVNEKKGEQKLNKTHFELTQLVNDVKEQSKRKSSMFASSLSKHGPIEEQPSIITDNLQNIDESKLERGMILASSQERLNSVGNNTTRHKSRPGAKTRQLAPLKESINQGQRLKSQAQPHRMSKQHQPVPSQGTTTTGVTNFGVQPEKLPFLQVYGIPPDLQTNKSHNISGKNNEVPSLAKSQRSPRFKRKTKPHSPEQNQRIFQQNGYPMFSPNSGTEAMINGQMPRQAFQQASLVSTVHVNSQEQHEAIKPGSLDYNSNANIESGQTSQYYENVQSTNPNMTYHKIVNYSQGSDPQIQQITDAQNFYNIEEQNQQNQGMMIQSVQPLTLSAVRQTRCRIENDVKKMHNRVHLLEQEEERALRMIDATRQKAEKIKLMRTEHDKFKLELFKVKEKSLKDKSLLSSRREKMRIQQSLLNEENIRQQQSTSRDGASPTNDAVSKDEMNTSSFLAGSSVFDPASPFTSIKLKQESIRVKKAEEALMVKKHLRMVGEKRDRTEMREQIDKRKRCDSIREVQNSLKVRKLSVYQEKSYRAAQAKEALIRDEVKKISQKDQEARRLEKKEEKVLRRLRNAHDKQKQTIQYIQTVFQPPNQPLRIGPLSAQDYTKRIVRGNDCQMDYNLQSATGPQRPPLMDSGSQETSNQ